MCVLSIKVPIRKKSENLFNDPRRKSFFVKDFSGYKEFSAREDPTIYSLGNCFKQQCRSGFSISLITSEKIFKGKEKLTTLNMANKVPHNERNRISFA